MRSVSELKGVAAKTLLQRKYTDKELEELEQCMALQEYYLKKARQCEGDGRVRR